jgi:hypothetical protein
MPIQISSLIGLRQVASTGTSGYPLSTTTTDILVEWTAPDDGQFHVVFLAFRLVVLSTLTGGNVYYATNSSGSIPDFSSGAGVYIVQPNTMGPGDYNVELGAHPFLIGPGDQVYLQQLSVVTAGAGTVFANLYAE